MYVLVSGTYHRVVSRNLCQKSWKAERSRDSTVIIPLYVVPQIWAYSATISTSLDRFFLTVPSQQSPSSCQLRSGVLRDRRSGMRISENYTLGRAYQAVRLILFSPCGS